VLRLAESRRLPKSETDVEEGVSWIRRENPSPNANRTTKRPTPGVNIEKGKMASYKSMVNLLSCRPDAVYGSVRTCPEQTAKVAFVPQSSAYRTSTLGRRGKDASISLVLRFGLHGTDPIRSQSEHCGS